jgi:diacylglycerol kinase family enzyme
MQSRAVVIVNPRATRTTPRGRDVLASALSRDVDAAVVLTQARGHASELARKAVAEDADLIVVLGGDGTVNEVVNGLLTDVEADHAAARVPVLGIVPGGSTNVLARALGLPRDPVEATGALLEAIRHGTTRTIGLGRANDRFFTFGAGLGLDADVVERVEARRAAGARSTTSLWLRAAAGRVLARGPRVAPRLTLTAYAEGFGAPPYDMKPYDEERPSVTVEGASTLIVSNTTPWTYLGPRPIHANPRAAFDRGLDALAVMTGRRAATVRIAAGLLRATGPTSRRALRLEDVGEIAVNSDRPVGAQVDGDFLGPTTRVTYRAVPAALRVAVPLGSGDWDAD